MKYSVDTNYMLEVLRELIETPSPVGYYVKILPIIEKYAEELGVKLTYDNRRTPYFILDGENNDKTVYVCSHLDTLGLVVKKVEGNGWLALRSLGGLNFASIEGENVVVHTRDGKEYGGVVMCRSHSVHVFDDCKSRERNENSLVIMLDENVKSADEVKALGISTGDVISIVPRFQVTPSGFVKSRFIDDKGGVAACLAAIKYLKDNGMKPKYRTVFGFTFYEEIGLGGCYIPPEADEMVAVDIGLIGPDYDGNEFKVSICQKDGSTFYNYELTTLLVNTAKAVGADYALDLYYRYGTDGGAALRAGNNIKCATFGMAVYASHGVERTHIDGLNNTAALTLGYILGDAR